MDVQCSALRFATAGGESKVKVWSLHAALDAQQENSGTRLLATLTEHTAPVNIVRFSPNGKLLASGSDDHMACIFEHRTGPGGNVLGGEANVENWRSTGVLRGHANNIMDLCWSPDSTRVATSSLDNTVMIWDVATSCRIALLDRHTSFVKGLAWDPIGTYLTSQAEDKSVIVWRTDDWSVVAIIKSPFKQMVTSTFGTRMSWSPDGQALIAGNSSDGGKPVAVVIPRGKWEDADQRLFMQGHSGTVVATAFNPHLFRLPPHPAKNGSAKAGGGADALSSVFAIGSQDKQVTVWAAGSTRALFCGTKFFKSQVLDLAWSPNGYSLFAASSDGTVALIQFGQEDLGTPASSGEVDEALKRLYGETRGQARKLFAESAEALELEESSPLLDKSAAKNNKRAAESEPLSALDARLNIGGAATQVGFGLPLSGSRAAEEAPVRKMMIERSGPSACQDVQRSDVSKRARITAAHNIFSPITLSQPEIKEELHVNMGKFAAGLTATNISDLQLHIANKQLADDTSWAEIVCSVNGAVQWSDKLRGQVILACGNINFSAVGLANGHIIIFSAAGRRLFAPMKMGAGLIHMSCGSEWNVLVVTTSARAKLMDVKKPASLMDASLSPLIEDGSEIVDARLSKSGVPLFSLSNCTVYARDTSVDEWIAVVDDSCALSQYVPALNLEGQGEISQLQAAAVLKQKAGARGLSLSSLGQTRLGTQSFAARAQLEAGMASAVSLNRPDEYKGYLSTYVRFLSSHGDQKQLEELCLELFGDGSSAWQPDILGLSKRELLRDVLKQIATNRGLQRVVTKYRDLLDEYAK